MVNLKKSIMITSLLIIVLFANTNLSLANSTINNIEYISQEQGNNENSPRSILIMNSSSKTTFNSTLLEGLNLSIEDNLPDHQIIKNYTFGLTNDEILTNIKSLINDKRNNIELIICLDNISTSFFKEYGIELFGDTPILFGYEGDNPIDIAPNMGGIFVPYKLDEFLNSILPLHKNTTQINFLVNKDLLNTYFFNKIQEYIDEQTLDPNNNLKFKIVTAGQSYDVIPILSEKNSLNIIYSPIRFKNSENDPGKYISPYGSIEKIAGETSNPNYGGFKTYGTRFNIGSYTYEGFDIGTKLGDYANQILNENLSIKTLGIKPIDKGPILFINQELQNFYRFPDNFDKTIYYNKGTTESSYATRKIKIISSIAIITFILLIIFVLRNHFRKKSIKEQEKLDSIKTNFITNISHELRTPLNIIISTIQLFDLYSQNGDIVYNNSKAKEKMNYLRGNSFRLLRLVNNIIDITRIDSGYFTINKIQLNIVSIVEEITLSSVAYAEKKEINLIFDTDIEELIISVDKDRIERIVLNLLSNALKFTPSNGTITVKVISNITYVTIIVTDTGIGIPEDKFDIIFKRFRQVDSIRLHKSEGSGIGLALCKSMIEMHNGTITVESEIDKGTSFIINIPIEKIDTPIVIDNLYNSNADEVLQVEYSDFPNYI